MPINKKNLINGKNQQNKLKWNYMFVCVCVCVRVCVFVVATSLLFREWSDVNFFYKEKQFSDKFLVPKLNPNRKHPPPQINENERETKRNPIER